MLFVTYCTDTGCARYESMLFVTYCTDTGCARYESMLFVTYCTDTGCARYESMLFVIYCAGGYSCTQTHALWTKSSKEMLGSSGKLWTPRRVSISMGGVMWGMKTHPRTPCFCSPSRRCLDLR